MYHFFDFNYAVDLICDFQQFPVFEKSWKSSWFIIFMVGSRIQRVDSKKLVLFETPSQNVLPITSHKRCASTKAWREGSASLKLGSGRSGGLVCSRTAKTTTGPVGWYSSREKYRKFPSCVSFPSTSILWILFGKIFLPSEKNSQILSNFFQFLPAAHFFLIISQSAIFQLELYCNILYMFYICSKTGRFIEQI